ncbi:hypothetical protein FOZ62_023578 [Perkinsus olseni]|uniref:Uncharacterized protein n=1 Tax=Perkinsus olseni TaxID=32597 RepID=A0A7J6TK13_PEROL|nr:hypothetical protein FOZ62_023578 [Perkinsus olseni]
MNTLLFFPFLVWIAQSAVPPGRYHLVGPYPKIPVRVLDFQGKNTMLFGFKDTTIKTTYTMSSTGCSIQPKLSKSQTAQLAKKYPQYIEATTLANLQCSTSGGFTISIDYKGGQDIYYSSSG